MFISKFIKRKLYLVAILVVSLSLNSLRPARVAAEANRAGAGTPQTICLTLAPRLEKFPDVSLDFRAIDSQKNVVSGITTSDIQAQENSSAPVPVTVSGATTGTALNLFFVIDIGNRTDPALVNSTLQAFSSMLRDGVDETTIIGDQGNGSTYLLKITKSLNDFKTAIRSLPKGTTAYSINNALDQALRDIKGQNYGCSRTNEIIVLAGGDNTLESDIDIQHYIDNANSELTKLDFLHFPDAVYNTIKDEPRFDKLANGTNGIHRLITGAADINTSLPLLNLIDQEKLYTADYRSNNGENTDRNVILLYQGRNITQQPQTYSVTVTSPTVTVTSPADGTVLLLPAPETKDTSKDTVDVQFSLDWPDKHPRNIKSASLEVTSTAGTKTAMTIPSGVPYEFNWSIAEYRTQKVNALNFKVSVVDEFGMPATSQTVSLKINYSVIPPPPINWMLYVLYGIVAILVVMLILMSRKIKSLASSGAVKRFVDQVRKTLVGGAARKGKPLAVIKVIDGPASLVNQELNIYAESVKLGRDPQKSDLTFYTPDARSSVSGYHCRIERMKGDWRIIATSTSGSQTFVDDKPIPFSEPYPLESGQTVRMGYLAQQPVVFQFITAEPSSEQEEEGSMESTFHTGKILEKTQPEEEPFGSETENSDSEEAQNKDDIRRTKVKVVDIDGRIAPSEPLHKPSGEDDDLFAEYRDKG